MTRRRLARSGSTGKPWAHLQPVLEAEADWGNTSRDGFRRDRDGRWGASMRHPLNVEGLLETFEFPDSIRVGREPNGDTWLVDVDNDIRVHGLDPHRRLGPARPPRTGLLAKVFGP